MKVKKEYPFHILLKMYREAHWGEIKQTDLAKHLEVHVNTVSNWERGQSFPTRQQVAKIAAYLELSEDDQLRLFRAFGETPPEVYTVPPTLDNMYFTGREDVLQRLSRYLSTKQPPVLALYGLGGMGKTQIAAEYARRHREERYRAVLWVRADSREMLLSSFMMLAQRLQLPQQHEQDQYRIVEAVKDWLDAHTHWLLIFDNVDNIRLAAEFFPDRKSGPTRHIVLTTLSPMVGTYAQGIAIRQMPQRESVLFLLKRAKLLAPQAVSKDVAAADRRTAKQIVDLLGGLPLALDQAGAYIEEVECNLKGYLQRFQQQRAALLKQRGELAQDHASVVVTFTLSFERVQQQNPAAAELLQFCAFLHPDNIPQELLITGASMGVPQLEEFKQGPQVWDKATRVLRKYSLVHYHAERETLSVHQLVQVVLTDRMDAQTRRQWAERTVQVLSQTFPSYVEPAQWAACEQLLPHALICAKLIEEHHMATPEAAYLLNQAGYYLYERARYREAEALLQQALAIQEQLEPDHPDTALTLNNLGLLYYAQGLYKEAEPLYRQALAIREQLGPDRPHTARSLNTLGLLYYEQGLYERAEPLYRRALAIWEQQGSKQQSTATLLNNLALLYFEPGKYEQAEALLQQALAIREQLGPDHPDTALTLNNLAWLYIRQGRHEEAEPLVQRALVIDEQRRGPGHPRTALGLNSLAWLYIRQGRHEEAEALLQQALTINEKRLGPEHPHTAYSLTTLAWLYTEEGKDELAERLYRQALAIYEQQWGQDHHRTAHVLDDLADLYQKQGKYEQAEPLLQRSLTIREQRLGQEDPDIAASRDALAALYYKQGKYEQAEPLLRSALAIREQRLGLEHPDTAMSLHNLAALYYAQGKYEQAKPLLRRSLAIYEQQPEPRHRQMVSVLEYLAALSQRCQRYEEAVPLQERALAMQEQQLGRDHLATAQSLSELARLYDEVNRREEAERLMQRSLSIYEQRSGPTHLDTAESLSLLAEFYMRQGKYQQAEPLLQRALAIYIQQLGSEHTRTASCRAAMAGFQPKGEEGACRMRSLPSGNLGWSSFTR